jgi:hypothetical protein
MEDTAQGEEKSSKKTELIRWARCLLSWLNGRGMPILNGQSLMDTGRKASPILMALRPVLCHVRIKKGDILKFYFMISIIWFGPTPSHSAF